MKNYTSISQKEVLHINPEIQRLCEKYCGWPKRQHRIRKYHVLAVPHRQQSRNKEPVAHAQQGHHPLCVVWLERGLFLPC